MLSLRFLAVLTASALVLFAGSTAALAEPPSDPASGGLDSGESDPTNPIVTGSQDEAGEAEEELDSDYVAEGEVIVVVGSHGRQGRTVVDSPVAIDVIDTKRIATETGQLDINSVLHLAAPSFNSNKQSGADGADHIEPATLRGLGPDQTLVLINGKRRHQSSLINMFGTRGRGNTGTDMNAIPIAAIERIEILRDGASALYGSDAIAGVINIVLKKNVGELDTWTSVSANLGTPPGRYDVGSTDAFDGETINASANYGFGIGKGGFVNVTVDYNREGRTQRPADPEQFEAYRRQFGQAASDRISTFINAELPVGDKVTLFAFGGHSFRYTDAFAWTRSPDSERNIPEIYPDGFDPRITSTIHDASASAGARIKLGKWDAEISNTYGINHFDYRIKGTLNASLLASSPTAFDAGGHMFAQNVTGAQLSRSFDFLKNTDVTFGGEFRVDQYRIFAGEEGSYRNYGLVERMVDGQLQIVDELGRPGGSQGFPGYRPENEVNEFRNNVAAYASGVFDITRDLLVDTAVRYEHYSDFGSTLNAKVATRLELVDLLGINFMHKLALRASASTGFRAPSLAQLHFNSVFTDFEGGTAIDKVIARNTGDITRAVGIAPLKEEKSRNASVGVTAQAGKFRVTVDGYVVDIRDRVVLTGTFDQTDPEIGGDLMALNVGAAQFFANALDTRTFGVDAIVDGTVDLGDHQLRPFVSANFNWMELGDIKTTDRLAGKEETFFGNREEKFLLASAPPSKISVGLGYRWDSLTSNLRLTRFDKVVLVDWTDEEDVYNPRITTDLNVGWKFTDNLSLVVGGTNVFNVYPTQQDTETESGGLWDAVQMGYNGAEYYAKLNARL